MTTPHQLERDKHRTPRTSRTLPVALRTPDPLAPQPLLPQAPSEPFLSLLLPTCPVSCIPSSLHCSTRHRACRPVGAPTTFLSTSHAPGPVLDRGGREAKCSLPCSFQAGETEANKQKINQQDSSKGHWELERK